MELQLKIIGAILILLALVHVVFPRYFDWENDLKSMSLINRQIMQVHTLFIALTVLLMGILCMMCSRDLIHTRLGHAFCLGPWNILVREVGNPVFWIFCGSMARQKV